MEKIIGLDLGTNSIGWAIRDTSENENQIIDKGVLVFDKGVADVEGIEQPKVKVRTEARGKRRNYQAEKYRKFILLQCLIENKMCPLTLEELNKWRHYNKDIGRQYPQSKNFLQWLRYDFNNDGKPDYEEFGFSKHENCYLFRWLAVSEKEEHKNIFRNNPHILGRVFYHLAQRRGFRKGDDDAEIKLIENGRPRKNSEGKVITGEVEVVGIKVIDNLIKKYKTLGAALYFGQKNNELESNNNNRIRNRFTYRDYFKNEINIIFENLGFDKQTNFYKTICTSIIEQRPLRSQKGLVGYCTLDNPLKSKTGIYYKPGKKRIPISHPLYEEYRMWCFINNLKIEPPSGIDKITFINEVVVPFFNRSTDLYFSDKKDNNGRVTKGFKTKIKEAGGKVLSNYDTDLSSEDEVTKFNANTFLFRVEKIFGENWKILLKWDETLKNIEKTGKYLRVEDIWHLYFDELITKKQTENFSKKIIPILKKNFPEIEFNECDFKQVNDFDKGYSSLSASSITKILPYLKKGLIYSQAVFVANIEKVFNKILDENTLNSILFDFNEINRKHVLDKEIYNIVNNLISDRLFYKDRLNMGENYVLDKYDLNDIDEKIKDTFKKEVWDRKTENQQVEFRKDVGLLYLSFLKQPIGVRKSNQFYKIYRIEEKLKDLLINKYKADDRRIKNYLWHPAEQEKYPPANVKKDKNNEIIKNQDGVEIYFLGDPNPISKGFKNPMAIKTLQNLKKLLNYLLLNGKIDSNTKIVIELARNLNDSNRRKAIERYQKYRRNLRDDYKLKINEFFNSNININDEQIDRYELWLEQSKKCLYCNQNIECTEILNGTAQVEHTIPAKISNCSELYNLTIAHPKCNQLKAKRIPSELENYEDIKNNIKFIYAKLKEWEEKFKETFKRAKQATTKENKDKIISERHYFKMHYDYWYKKYETFTLTEITSKFRRQQLTDTQIITKYSLPYLKTVFSRIDVQNGITTSKFRKIYKIEPKNEDEKKRDIHSHHAVDAAVLTLIPPANIRDNILKEYNEYIDNNNLNNYPHPKPRNWENFHESKIISIKNEIIINHVTEQRTFKQSFKYLRKRGEFVKDKNGNNIYQRGSTIRGQLHEESFLGLIKIPNTEIINDKHRLIINEGKLTFVENEKSKNDNYFVVKKIKITDITSIDILKNVVDPNLRLYLENEINKRIKETDFKTAISNPIYAFGKSKDKNGNQLQPIRHIRCKVKNIVNPSKIKQFENAFKSKKEYKQFVYAKNKETPIAAFFEWIENEKVERKILAISILEMCDSFKEGLSLKDLSKRKFNTIVNNTKYRKFSLLYKNQHVIFYNESLEEIKELYISNLNIFIKRIYKVVGFEDGRVTFEFHLTSLSKKDISSFMKSKNLTENGVAKIDFESPILRLRLTQKSLNMAIEGIDFEIALDGTIIWKEN